MRDLLSLRKSNYVKNDTSKDKFIFKIISLFDDNNNNNNN